MTTELPLLELGKLPSMAAAFTSIDDGEGWQWGRFYLTFETQPTQIGVILAKALHGRTTSGTVTYHYVVNVFYKPEESPHGPSIRPVASIGIEQLYVDGMNELVKSLYAESGLNSTPVMVGLFKNGLHLNYGDYTGPLNPDAARSHLFDVLKQQMNLEGTPSRIGTMKTIRHRLGTSSDRGSSNLPRLSLALIGLAISAVILWYLWG